MNAYAKYSNPGVPALVEAGWPVNQIRYWVYQTVQNGQTLSIGDADAQFAALTPEQKVAQTTTTQPAGSYGLRLSAGGSGVLGGLVIDPPARPSVLNLKATWIAGVGLWEVENQANPVPDSGQKYWWFINGAEAVARANNETTNGYPVRRYPPGTWLSVIGGMGYSKDIRPYGYVNKAQQYAYLGNP